MNVGTFVTTDGTIFSHIGSILEAMLAKVPSNTEFINMYRPIPKFGEGNIPTSLQAVLDVGAILQRDMGKLKAKFVEDAVTMKPNTQSKLKKKAKVCVVDEDMEENVVSDDHLDDNVQNDDDTSSSSKQPQTIEQPVTTTIPTPTTNLNILEIPRVSFVPTIDTTPLTTPTYT
ncbi:unnamed protein product [Lactuca saligna]|uniref:Uncharacterized protein n=1 Tax=Lactuca saligna TaxID=75948 RepID=A0AA35YXB1_LACSI|nr:unnamed protein product [Lactuca saligna]